MRDFKLYISVATLFLVLYLVAEYNKPAPINWQPTMYYNDKIPFGTFILYRQLPQLFPGAKPVNTNKSLFDEFHDKSLTNSNYFIFSKSVTISKYDFKEMVKYIQAGNSVFISAFEWEGFLADTLHLTTKEEFKKKDVGVNFINSKLKQAKDYHYDHELGNAYFSRFDTAHAIALGKNELGDYNFLCFKFGKGNLYLNANPELFTNFALLSSHGADYAAKALSYLPVQPNIYWDEYQNGDIMVDESPLRVFFEHSSLQWAYFISLFSLVIFVLYEMKRRQRIIPVIEPLRNSTVEFVNVVGQVYYEQRDNQNIAQKKVLYFLEYLRTHYYLKTNPLDAEFIERLAHKTGIEESFATEIINHINQVMAHQYVSDNDLIILNQLIQKFYTKSR